MNPDRNLQGQPPPAEWWVNGHGQTTAAEYRAWLDGTGVGEKKRSKFGAKAGRHADLDNLYLKSQLEANALRLLRFMGYELWQDKEQVPPAAGQYVAYEWQRFRLLANRGKVTERPVFYLPDFHLWDDGVYSVWEAKGVMDARSKRLLRLMSEQHPEIPVALITAEELGARRTEVFYRARHNGTPIADIPHWNE